MINTVLEALKDEVRKNGYGFKKFNLDDYIELDLTDDYETQEHSGGVIYVDDDYFYKTSDVYLKKLVKQYEDNKEFDKKTLYDFAHEFSSNYVYIADGMRQAVDTNVYDKDVLLQIAKAYIEESSTIFEFSNGLLILAFLDYEDEKREIEDIDEILKIIMHYSWVDVEALTIYYTWDKFDYLFEKIDSRENGLTHYAFSYIPQMFKPIKADIFLKMISEYWFSAYIFYREIDIKYYLENHYSKDLLVGILRHISPVIKGSRIESVEKNTIEEISDFLTEKILLEEFDEDYYGLIYNFYLRLKRNRNTNHKLINNKFKNNDLWKDFKNN